VTVISDVDAVAAKIVALKSVFPRANAFNIVSRQPKLLLKSTDRVLQDAEIVSLRNKFSELKTEEMKAFIHSKQLHRQMYLCWPLW